MIIIFIYLLIIFAVGMAFYFAFRTTPTCEDGKRNQGETEVDCGGPCPSCREVPEIENIEVIEKHFIPAGGGRYDVMAKIRNPNSEYGVPELEYKLVLLGQDGKIISEKAQTGFVLPGQKKYFLAFNLDPSEKPAAADIKISSFKWSRFHEYKGPDVSIYQKEFNLVSGGTGFAQLKGKIRNQSGFDFRNIAVKAILRDGSDSPIAVNETSFNDVREGEEREFTLNWSHSFPIDPVSVKIEVESDVDVFHIENFMRVYGAQEQYESYELK